MTLRDLSQLDLKRKQYRVILYLAEGEASFAELCQALGVSKTQGYEAVSPLVRQGLVEKEGSRYRLAFALELPQAPSEEKPKRGPVARSPSPRAPWPPWPRPTPTSRASSTSPARPSPRWPSPWPPRPPGSWWGPPWPPASTGGARKGASWCPGFPTSRPGWRPGARRPWKEALTEATKKADKPFPYARKLLLARPEEAPEVPEEELGYF
jgi:hypothetical protein